MSKINYLLSLSFCTAILFSNALWAQYNYYPEDSIDISYQNYKLKFPFQGGFNAPQFNQIDLDQDGKLDLIIFDRAGNRLTPLLNKGGTNEVKYEYAPQYISSFPFIEDQLYTRDFDCDNDMDLIIYGSGRGISVFENQSTLASGLAFSLHTQPLQATNSFGPVNIIPGNPNIIGIEDVDQDGDIDIVLEHNYGSQFTYYKNLSIENTNACGLMFEERSQCWGLVVESGNSFNIYLDSCRFPNIPNPEFRTKEEQKLGNTSKRNKHGSSALALFDLDDNGSMDLILGDDGYSNIKAIYNADSLAPHTSSRMFKVDSSFPSYSTPVELTTFPITYFLDLDNDNRKDMIVSTNSDDVLSYTQNKNHIQFYKRNTNNHQFNLSNKKLFFKDILDFGLGSYPAFFDYNKDGLQDIIVGNIGYYDSSLNNYKGQLALLINTGSSAQAEFELADTNFLDIPSQLFSSGTRPIQRLVPTFGDIDNDGDLDLIIGDEDGFLHLFTDTSNSGSAAFKLEERRLQKITVYENASPALCDIDGDSLLDLVIANNNGLLEYHENYGSTQNPIYNLEVQSILWQYDTIIRYQLKGNPNLSRLNIGDQIDVNNETHTNNGVYQTIFAINDQMNYIDCINPYRNDNTYDELNSSAVIDYSIKNWGNLNLNNTFYSRNIIPFIYNENGKNFMITSNQEGRVFLIDSLSNNPQDTFRFVDSSYFNSQFGHELSINGADINNDGIIDFVLGNKAGGIRFFRGVDNVGLDENTSSNHNQFNLRLFPNPAQKIVHIELERSYQAQNEELILYDMNGRLLKRFPSKTKSIDVSDLSSGLYFLHYQDQENTKTQKLIIQQ